MAECVVGHGAAALSKPGHLFLPVFSLNQQHLILGHVKLKQFSRRKPEKVRAKAAVYTAMRDNHGVTGDAFEPA